MFINKISFTSYWVQTYLFSLSLMKNDMKESVIFQNLSSKSMILRDLRQYISWNWSLCLQFMTLILMLMSDIVEDINIKQIIRIILEGNDLKQSTHVDSFLFHSCFTSLGPVVSSTSWASAKVEWRPTNRKVESNIFRSTTSSGNELIKELMVSTF